nr:MAG TPA: hydrogenase/urease nickel incorporation protein [Caudoviricetes sp.]
MKEKILYTCEICHTDYTDKKTAKECEVSHKKGLKIVNQRFRPYTQDRSGFPIRIEVADEKGNKAVYKR